LRNKSIYFDTNAILDMSQLDNPLRKRRVGVTHERVRQLKRLVAQGKLTVLVSVCQVQELAEGLLSRNPSVSLETVRKDMRFFRGIVCRDGLIEENSSDIVRTDMQRCLAGQEAASHLISAEEVLGLLDTALEVRTLSDLLSWLDAFGQAHANTVRYKKHFDGCRDDFRQERAQLAATSPEESNPSEKEAWDRVWDVVTASTVRCLAAKLGVAEQLDDLQVCRLLKVKSVRLVAGYRASYLYELWFPEKGSHRRRSQGDYGDQMHAIFASTADVFVAGDIRFVELLNRIPNRGVRVLSLPDFLSHL